MWINPQKQREVSWMAAASFNPALFISFSHSEQSHKHWGICNTFASHCQNPFQIRVLYLHIYEFKIWDYWSQDWLNPYSHSPNCGETMMRERDDDTLDVNRHLHLHLHPHPFKPMEQIFRNTSDLPVATLMKRKWGISNCSQSCPSAFIALHLRGWARYAGAP